MHHDLHTTKAVDHLPQSILCTRYVSICRCDTTLADPTPDTHVYARCGQTGHAMYADPNRQTNITKTTRTMQSFSRAWELHTVIPGTHQFITKYKTTFATWHVRFGYMYVRTNTKAIRTSYKYSPGTGIPQKICFACSGRWRSLLKLYPVVRRFVRRYQFAPCCIRATLELQVSATRFELRTRQTLCFKAIRAMPVEAGSLSSAQRSLPSAQLRSVG